MGPQGKKTFAVIDYQTCDPTQCDPETGKCAAAKACPQKIIIQIDGVFEQPMVNHELCQGCWECLDACPLGAVTRREVGV